MALPIALFSSSTESFKPQEFIKSILNASSLPEPKVVCDQIESYEWHFETKYYDTCIQLCTTQTRTIGDADFATSVEAFVHFFDPNSHSSFDGVKAWLPYLKHIEPEVQMLVCTTNKSTDVICRRVVQEWCIQHGFELVELQPETETEDSDDDFPETTGMTRIIQALHAHSWPNLNMKNTPTVYSPYMLQMMKDQQLCNKQQQENEIVTPDYVPLDQQIACEDITNSTQNAKAHDTNHKQDAKADVTNSKQDPCSSDLNSITSVPSSTGSEAEKIPETSSCTVSSHTSSIEVINTRPEEAVAERLDDIDWATLLKSAEGGSLTGDDLGVEEFEQLFMKLKVMKDKADVLPPEERKKYAEKVAISFWKAVGGDEDEIEGLDDDSD